MPTLLSSFLPLLLLLLVFPAKSQPSSDPLGCRPSLCGSTNVSYPFWIPSRASSSSFCGYPVFDLVCLHNTTLTLQILDRRFTVLHISTSDHTLSLVDSDIVHDSSCPQPSRNLTLERSSPIRPARDAATLILLSNCSSSTIGSPIECRPGWFVATSDQIDYPNGTCGEVVAVPVLKEAVEEEKANLGKGFGRVLEKGFRMEWDPTDLKDCKGCELSGGRCGYRNDSGEGLALQCFCADGTHKGSCLDRGEPRVSRKILLGASLAGCLLCIIFVLILYLRRSSFGLLGNGHKPFQAYVEDFLAAQGPLALTRYSYKQVKQMTNSFRTELGRGGFGSVFEGNLNNNDDDVRIPVAVKLLGNSNGSGEDFINEVASIGRTNHVNIVSLLGFCSEGSKRALIYEFMSNGSLEKYLFSRNQNTSNPLGWDQLYKIALGIAKGLEYLHKGCRTRIVHFDIKPHNILLDKDFCPKISDFGLAKFCQANESILSMDCARGTIGYIAPEVFSKNFGVVSSKSDVYSYGMMVLEMVGGRRNFDGGVDKSSEIYFPHWIYEHLDQHADLVGDGMAPENAEVVKKMAMVGLWCIQTNPSCRPSISRAVEMLEERVEDLEMPPKPYICSPERSTPNITSYCSTSMSAGLIQKN